MAGIGTKRAHDWEVSEMEEGREVCVHGIPSKVSPRKESRKTKGCFYFDARLTDGKKTARIFSFNTTHMAAVKKAAEEQTAIALENCDVKSSKINGSLEVQLRRHTKVVASQRKISLGEDGGAAAGTPLVKVMQVKGVAVGEKVSLKCKIIKVSEPEIVTKKATGKQLKKQNVIVADESGQCRLVLWESDVGGLEEGRTYLLVDVAVRKYNFTRHLSYNQESTHELADDLQEVDDSDNDDDGGDGDEYGRVVEGEITLVKSASEYLSCRACKCKVIMKSETLAKCNKCGSYMKASACSVGKAATFTVMDAATKQEIELSAFDPVLEEMVEGLEGASVALKLLAGPPRRYRYNEEKRVFAVAKV